MASDAEVAVREICATCKFSMESGIRGDARRALHCRRYPPVGIERHYTEYTSWCGEWRPKTAEHKRDGGDNG